MFLKKWIFNIGHFKFLADFEGFVNNKELNLVVMTISEAKTNVLLPKIYMLTPQKHVVFKKKRPFQKLVLL